MATLPEVNPNANMFGDVTGAPAGQTVTKDNQTSDSFLSQLQSKLMSSAGMVSSDNTALEQNISDIVGNLKKSNAAGDEATTIDYNRQEDAARLKGTNDVTSFQEASRGYSTNTAVLSQINDQTDKTLKDLDLRKKEAILNNDSATAGKIADLQIQALSMRQAANQKTFDNLLSMGNFGLNMQKQKDELAFQQKNQSFAESQAISTIALKYGIKVQAGDTLASISAKAAPFASAEEKAQMAEMAAKTNEANANAAKALKGETVLDPLTIATLAKSANNNPSVLNLMDVPTRTKVLAQMEKDSEPRAYSSDELSTAASQAKDSGTPLASAKAAIASNPQVLNKQAAYAALDAAYGPQPKPKSTLDQFGDFMGKLMTPPAFMR